LLIFHSGDKKLEIIFGHHYGPPESELDPQIPNCLVPASYTAPCKHQSTQPCNDAFNYASKKTPSPECSSPTNLKCPICCSPDFECPCWLAQILTKWQIWADDQLCPVVTNDLIRVNESVILSSNPIKLPPELDPRGLRILNSLCKAKIRITRVCSPLHTCHVTCNDLLQLLQRTKKLPECKAQVDRKLACGHTVKVECHAMNQNPPPVCTQKVDTVYTYGCGVHTLRPGVCSKYTRLVEMEPQCKELVGCSRFRCGHGTKVPCYLKQLVEKASPGSRLSDWKEAGKSG